jgi:NAD(P)-dependent dehydrogenase (short-subunit alcohol dehydrogenase family)
VIVNHRDDAGPAEEVVGAIRAEGGDAVAARADICKAGDFAGLVDAAVAAYGRWDVLVNNAAIAPTKPITDFTDEPFDAMLAVNVRGPFLGCRLAATRMEPGGAVINISSSTTALMLPGYAAYDCTKGAVEALTHVLAREFGPRQTTVNTVSPGATDTESYRQGKARSSSPPWRPCRCSAGSVESTKSPPRSPSSPGQTPAGSPARTCASTAAQHDCSHLPRRDRAPRRRTAIRTAHPITQVIASSCDCRSNRISARAHTTSG